MHKTEFLHTNVRLESNVNSVIESNRAFSSDISSYCIEHCVMFLLESAVLELTRLKISANNYVWHTISALVKEYKSHVLTLRLGTFKY